MANSRNDMAEMATARANVYGLLGDVFREAPSEAFLTKLRAPDFSGALRSLGLSFGEVFEGPPQKQLIEDLAIEFTRLFIGPGLTISPHESMHLPPRFGEMNALWGPSTVAVKKFMQAAGVKIADGFTGMPDHLSAEFEFMRLLLLKEAEAWSGGDSELGGNILKIEMRFYDEHLSQWVCRFCDRVINAASNSYYRQFAEVTKAFIDFENDTLRGLVDGVIEDDKLSA